MLHKDISKTRSSRVSASSLLRGSWEDQGLGVSPVTENRELGWELHGARGGSSLGHGLLSVGLNTGLFQLVAMS